jgi:hypothetical protein
VDSPLLLPGAAHGAATAAPNPAISTRFCFPTRVGRCYRNRGWRKSR